MSYHNLYLLYISCFFELITIHAIIFINKMNKDTAPDFLRYSRLASKLLKDIDIGFVFAEYKNTTAEIVIILLRKKLDNIYLMDVVISGRYIS